MATVSETPLPADSLLSAHTTQDGTYTDCFEALVQLNGTPEATFQRFVFLFFDSSLFRVERLILRLSGKSDTGSTHALALAMADTDKFAAWHVQERRPTELLLTVPETPIRTWLALSQDGAHARLRFGSAIVAHAATGKPHWGFRATVGGHRLYSRLLMRAALSDWARGKMLPG